MSLAVAVTTAAIVLIMVAALAAMILERDAAAAAAAAAGGVIGGMLTGPGAPLGAIAGTALGGVIGAAGFDAAWNATHSNNGGNDRGAFGGDSNKTVLMDNATGNSVLAGNTSRPL